MWAILFHVSNVRYIHRYIKQPSQNGDFKVVPFKQMFVTLGVLTARGHCINDVTVSIFLFVEINKDSDTIHNIYCSTECKQHSPELVYCQPRYPKYFSLQRYNQDGCSLCLTWNLKNFLKYIFSPVLLV